MASTIDRIVKLGGGSAAGVVRPIARKNAKTNCAVLLNVFFYFPSNRLVSSCLHFVMVHFFGALKMRAACYYAPTVLCPCSAVEFPPNYRFV